MQLKNYLLALGLIAGSIWTAQGTTCPNAVAITSVPVTNQSVVCGTANDINGGNVAMSCGDTIYYHGQEALYVWTPTVSGQTTISLDGPGNTGIFVFQGCPTSAGAICHASETGFGSSKSVTLNVFAGTQYYIMFDVLIIGGSPCTGGSSATFSVTAPLACTGISASIAASASDDTVCFREFAELTLSGQSLAGGISVQWQASTTSSTTGFTNITDATDTTYFTDDITATTYFRAKVTCPFTNDSVFSNVLTIGVRPLPVVNLGNDTTVCGNVQSFVLNAGNPGAMFFWMGNLSTGATLNIAPPINALNNNAPAGNGTATYTSAVLVIDTFGCVGRDTIRVTVNLTARAADYTINGLDPTLTFTPVADSLTTSYAWNFGDGGTATTRVATHTYNASGVYTVRLVVSNACGSDTVVKFVQVTTTGVLDASADALVLLYPNPASTDAVLEVPSSSGFRRYLVLNAVGAVVAERTLDGGVTRTTLNLSTFAPGIYTLRIELDEGVVVRKLEVIK